MKKLIVCLSAVALLTTPAMAELGDNATILDSSHWTATPLDGGRPYTSAAFYVYDNMWTAIGGPTPRTINMATLCGFTTPGASYLPPSVTVADDFTLTQHTFSAMHYIYWATGTSLQTFTQLLAFQTDNSLPTGGPGAIFASFSITGLPGSGGWIMTLGLPTLVAPNSVHIWGAMVSWGKMIDYPLGAAGLPPGIGGHQPKCMYPGVTSHAGNLMWAIGSPVPEPTTIGLLAIGGLLALRRRR